MATREALSPVDAGLLSSAAMPATSIESSPAAPIPCGVPSAPNHDGKPQDGRWLAFGDPTAAIGALRSVSSSLRVELRESLGQAVPPPVPAEWTAPVGGLLGFGVGAGAGVILTQVLWGVALGPILRAIGLWGSFTRLMNLGNLALFALIGGAVLAYVGVRVGRSLAPKFATQPVVPGVGEIALFVGAEGLAQVRRTATGASVNVVRFADTPHATFGMTRTTYKKQTGAVSFTTDKQCVQLFEEAGRSAVRIEGSKYDAEGLRRTDLEFHGAAAAAHAHQEFWAPRLIAAALSPTGAKFPYPRPGMNHFLVAAGRIELHRGGAAVQLTPAEVTELKLESGTVRFVSAVTGRVEVPLEDLCNGKLLLAVLRAQGVTLA